MRRKFNYTGRRRLERTRMDIKLVPRGAEPPAFMAALNLGGLDLPEGAAVYVEAHDRSSYMRFPLGTVGSPAAPGDAGLKELQSRDAISFRVKVVDESAKHGVILAIGEAMALDGSGRDTATYSLLPVRYQDIGQQVWHIDFTETGPVLEVNSNVGFPMRDFVARSPFFSSLVFPAVLAEVLRRVVLVRRVTDAHGEDWENSWLQFASRAGAPAIPEGAEDEALCSWVDEAVEAFCNRLRTREELERAVAGGVEQ